MHELVWAERTPQPPAELFVFRLSEEGYRRLRLHLEATKSGDQPIATVGESHFYRSVRPYHLFHTCHQYAAAALREAGLAITPLWALSRASFTMQLRRASRRADDHAAERAADGS